MLVGFGIPQDGLRDVVFEVIGAGGGDGGADSNGPGGTGASGTIVRFRTYLLSGTSFTLVVGGAGANGQAGGGVSGGTGGGYNSGYGLRHRGGTGGRSGSSGSSGSGAGGGAASALYKDGTLYAGAGGGGGGAGGALNVTGGNGQATVGTSASSAVGLDGASVPSTVVISNGTLLFSTRQLGNRTGGVTSNGTPSSLTVIPVTFGWTAATLANYAVYVSEDGSTPVNTVATTFGFSYQFTAPYSGNYTIRHSVDNIGYFSFDGGSSTAMHSFDADGVDTVFLTAGTHSLAISVYNSEVGGGKDVWSVNPGGVAIAIYAAQDVTESDGSGGGAGGGGATIGGSGGGSGRDNGAAAQGGQTGNSVVPSGVTVVATALNPSGAGGHQQNGRINIMVDGVVATFSYTGADQTFMIP